ncbi:ATP-binding cassette sub-family C member 4-like [Anthonomus grandis grandis]|uniref:ATP-binding cassette sub-family C member 4-like n=1 Tax=Anthonomus grandis grandis TaxID=2921223 RepID=UPI002165037E|nr:ATP-binding cassette sub-family C member 4-like [Anthonomus grandis grandis]
MDQAERITREKNPRERASIFSIIFFCFVAPLYKHANQRELQERDIYQIIPKFQSERLGDKLEKRWSRNKKKTQQDINKKSTVKQENGIGKVDLSKPKTNNISITACLIREFGGMYICLGFIQLIMKAVVLFLQPLAISKFIAYFQPNQTKITKTEFYGFSAFVIGVIVLNVIYNHNYQQWIMEFSVKVRTSLCSLIYRKALKLSPSAFSETAMGKVVTLITKDVYCIDGAMIFLNDMWISVIQITIVTVILYKRIGISVLTGIAFIILVVPIQTYCGRKFSLTRLKAAKKAEERIQLVKEALNAIKIIKMYTWEKYFEKIITFARIKETDKLKIIYYLKATIVTLGGVTIKVAFFLVVITYTLQGNAVSAEVLYFAQQLFFSLRSCVIASIPMGISNMAELFASTRRIQQYLDSEEYQPPEFTKSPTITPKVYLDKISVNIQGQEVLKSVSLDLDKGLLIVSGAIGSGKSSLLKAILGEYPINHGKNTVKGTISYAPEEPWLFPSTIRQNILFGQPYNEKRYQQVLSVCALIHDINQYEKLDNTVIGDKGINLSRGQQARICLARAIYRNSDIYLLDDCLSALDAHVNNHIFRECIQGFLKDKVVILISNNINNIKQVSLGSVLYMQDGKTLDLDQQKAALDKRITYYIDEDTGHFNPILDEIQENDYIGDQETDELLKTKEATEPRKNLYHEEKKSGSVLWKNYVTYYKYTGGIIVLLFAIVIFTVCQIAMSYSEKLLSIFVNQETEILKLSLKNMTDDPKYNQAIVEKNRLLKLYTIMIIVGTALTLTRAFLNFYFCSKAGRKLHEVLIKGVLNASMAFFDNHYIGNIVNRVSKDFYTIDESIPYVIYENLRLFFLILGTFILIVSTNYYFIIPSVLLLVALLFIQKRYMPAGRSLKRLEAATRSPMVGYINASLEGLTTVHSCREEKILQQEFDKHQDFFTSVYYMNQCVNRLFAFSLDMACQGFITLVVLSFTMFPEGAKPGTVGLAITQALTLTGLLQWAIRQSAEMENTMTSVERVLEYADAQPEAKSGKNIPGWPKNGSIKYQNVSLTYLTTGERVLQDVSFDIDGGSKIGIIGRTGAGKTSIISILFRLYDFEGTIQIDDVDIKTVSLDVLRSRIGIIPQDPILFSGSIRTNIDPLSKYQDSEIWTALEKVQMKSHISSLEQEITEHGRSYSSGQRQLLCLARAIVCKNKIIVLDEATANMDVETDQMIQKTIREHFSDCTVLTIAHRLNNFDHADKILVIEGGKVVQFGKPKELLQDSKGLFCEMVNDAQADKFL